MYKNKEANNSLLMFIFDNVSNIFFLSKYTFDQLVNIFMYRDTEN